MKTLLTLLSLTAILGLSSCASFQSGTAKVQGWLGSPAGQATVVAVSKATAVAIKDIVSGDKKSALPDAVGSVLDSIHAQANGNPALVVVDAAGHAALLDALKKQGTTKTLDDAGVAALNALVNGASTPLSASNVPVPPPTLGTPLSGAPAAP